MKKSTINYITEIVHESNYIELYKATMNEGCTGKYNIACHNFTEEVTALFDCIADEIKSDIGTDRQGSEVDDFEYNIGNGQISCYMFISLGVNDFEIRLSDHEDRNNCGNRIQRSVLENNSKQNIINSIVEELTAFVTY